MKALIITKSPSCHAAIDHPQRGAVEHGHQANGDDELLAGVEHGQRALALEGGTAVTLQVLVVALRLEIFVVEVLHGFVVQQRVDGLLCADESSSFISRRNLVRHSVTVTVKVT